MAEALLNHIGKEEFEAESAGLTPTALNPLCIQAMKEIGLDISNNKAKEVFDLYRAGKFYNYVVSVCDESIQEKCPIFPGTINRLEWSFSNPADLTGSEDEKMKKVREIRDAIRLKVENFVDALKVSD
jgi:arsenate reductase